MKHKKRRKPKIERTAGYYCAYVSKMAVLIIFRFPPDSYQSHNAVYWRTGREYIYDDNSTSTSWDKIQILILLNFI